jgi:hypothetical protein
MSRSASRKPRPAFPGEVILVAPFIARGMSRRTGDRGQIKVLFFSLQPFIRYYKMRQFLNMAHPKIPPHKRARAAGISLPPSLIRDARKQADRNGLTLSAFVRILLTQRLNGTGTTL